MRRAYLPVMLGLAGRRILVFGGGRVAGQKARMLRKFTGDITVVAPLVSPELARSGLRIIRDRFKPKYLRRAGLVYACTNDRRVNAGIKKAANRLGLLVNVADNPRLCDFITPAIFKDREMVVAVSSGGRNLAKTLRWRDRIRRLLRHG